MGQLCWAISSQLRHISTIGKNLLNNNISPTSPHNMVNFGPLTAEMRLGVWGTPTNFNGFRVLAVLLHGALWRQPNFAALNRGHHRYSAGRPCRWALADILVVVIIRSHRSTTYVDAAYSYRPSSVVCRSVCLSVCHTSEPCKNCCTDRAAVWVEDLGGPRGTMY